MDKPRTSPETRASLRQKYTPQPVPKCPHCGDAMTIDRAPLSQVRWTCLDHGHIRYTRSGGDPVIIAAVDDADALAGALAEAGRLRDAASTVLANASLPDSCDYCIVDNGEDGLDALRAALGQSAGQGAGDAGRETARLRARIQDALDTSWGDRGGERSAADALDDVRAGLSAALAGPAQKSGHNRALDGLQDPQAAKSGKDAGTATDARTAGNTKGTADGRAD